MHKLKRQLEPVTIRAKQEFRKLLESPNNPEALREFSSALLDLQIFDLLNKHDRIKKEIDTPNDCEEHMS